jgi:hypothetical protein
VPADQVGEKESETMSTGNAPETPEMAEALAPEAGPRKCRAVKHGNVTLHCTEPEGHDQGPDVTWHKAVYAEYRDITYDGARHVMDVTETVTWEPAGHVAEAARHLMAGQEDS